MPSVGVPQLLSMAAPREGTVCAYLSWYAFTAQLGHLAGKAGVDPSCVVRSERLLVPS
jgi:hypothetical protein